MKADPDDPVIDVDLLGNRNQNVRLSVLRRCHAMVARYVMKDPGALPIFDRLDRELRAAEARLSGDPIAAARAMLAAQNAKG